MKTTTKKQILSLAVTNHNVADVFETDGGFTIELYEDGDHDEQDIYNMLNNVAGGLFERHAEVNSLTSVFVSIKRIDNKKVAKAVERTVTPKADKPTIWFANERQVALWKNEILGQLSDGHWENAAPHDHWICWYDADVRIAEPNEKTGRNFYAKKSGYGLTSPLLLECVGDRMIEECKASCGLESYTMKEMKRDLNQMRKVMKAYLS